jgi:PAS domain S-box-containing protein
MENDVVALRARLAAIVDSSLDAILAKDLRGIITAWNPAAERLYGYSAAEILGRPVSLLIPDELAGESDAILREVIAGRAVPAHDTRRVTKSGQMVDVSVAVSPIKDGAGSVIGASTIARDISERIAAEATQAWTALLVEQSPDAIIAIDADRRITTWNPAAEALFGYTYAEAHGRIAQVVVRSDDTDAQVEISASVISSGRTHRYEAVRKHRDGHDLTVEISIAPLDGPDGQPRGAVVSIRDVTAARAAERRIDEARTRELALEHELEQTRRLESVGELAGGIAHDFNNLLAVILNLATFVASDLPEGSPARADVEEITLAAQRAAALTRQLLIFSRRDVVEPEVFDLGEVVAGLESFLRRALGERVRLEVAAADGLWHVKMDRGQMEQIVVNLAVNARDAMPDGGRLIIETGNTVVDDDFASTRVGLSPGDYITLTVSDTGVGMDADVVARAFEPFYTTKPVGQGTGLGLATVYGIVAKAGGRVALYSEPDRGTSVKVHLPVSTEAPRPTGGDENEAPGGRGEVVLVVEDAPDVRRVTERILTAAGYRVLTTDGAVGAFAALEASPVDLVLSDIIMPGVTGTELLARIRRERPGQRVLLMSGYSHKMLTPDVIDQHSSGFIEKPFTADQLRRKIRVLLDASVL